MAKKLSKEIATAWVYASFSTVVPKRGGSELTVPSPFPKKGDGGAANQSKQQIWINIEEDKWRCWASDYAGRFSKLVSMIEGCDERDAYRRFYEQSAAEVGTPSSEPRRRRESGDQCQKTIEMPPHCVRISEKIDSPERALALHYLESRGLPETESARLSYCTTGELSGYLIIPFFDRSGNMVYWQARGYKGQSVKYVAPPKSLAKSSDILYCRDWQMRGHPVFVCEGVFDAIGLSLMGLHAVAVLGSSVSDQQAMLMRKSGCDHAIIATDLDGAGEHATQSARSAFSRAGISKVGRVRPLSGKDFWDYYAASKDSLDTARNAVLSSIKVWDGKSAFLSAVMQQKSSAAPSKDRGIDFAATMEKLRKMS